MKQIFVADVLISHRFIFLFEPDGCVELLDVISAGGGETLNIESAVNFPPQG